MRMFVGNAAGSSETPAHPGQLVREPREPRVVLRQAPALLVQRDERGGGEDARLTHPASEELPHAPGLGDEGSRARRPRFRPARGAPSRSRPSPSRRPPRAKPRTRRARPPRSRAVPRPGGPRAPAVARARAPPRSPVAAGRCRRRSCACSRGRPPTSAGGSRPTRAGSTPRSPRPASALPARRRDAAGGRRARPSPPSRSGRRGFVPRRGPRVPERAWTLSEIWFPIEPVGTKRAASRPRSSAVRSSSRRIVGSSP